MRKGRTCAWTSGWDCNNWPANATGNNRRGNRQWDGKRSERKQDYLQRDRGRWENKPRIGTIGNHGRERTKYHTVSRLRLVSFPYRPHFPVPTFTTRAPAESSAAAGVQPVVKTKSLRRKAQFSVLSTDIGGKRQHGHGTGTGNDVIFRSRPRFSDRSCPWFLFPPSTVP